MPRGDGTGPEGRGSLTGRGLGSCTGNVRPRNAQRVQRGTGLGPRGNGIPRGGGLGRSMARSLKRRRASR